jgi:hypothetical protein
MPSLLAADYALGILMRLAADGEWRNPPLGSLNTNELTGRSVV